MTIKLDKEKLAAEAVTQTGNGFFQGLGYLGAIVAVPFVAAHVLVIAPIAAVAIAAHKFPNHFNRRTAEKAARGVSKWIKPQK